ncbi:porin family protein [Sulfurovum riftiae]|uniref:Outer membrane protein beta-barrel domain-containing protein n=1 Tax=Sulfurovum riftiae TaxID=1630136 RepID=A0A151CK35_9BACT|nr:porin family protein [Sulfurovum riftiae]KYJ87623.1 hypothetical protein AS592_11015 [Sulfurovum riftiae]
MKKQLLAAVFAAQLMTQLYAGGEVEPVETVETEAIEAEESRFYIVAKGMAIMGDDVAHGEAMLEGDNGYGFGIDIGYRLGHGFAVEYDFSYSQNTVIERVEGHEFEELDADYYTSALDIVYTYEMTETIGLFAKAGYELEWETIDKIGIDSEDHDGFVFGVGFEVAMNESYKFVAEYEHSTIDGPRGDALFAGLMLNF